MTAKEKSAEDRDMLFFQDLYASPAKSEASSVDLYEDLDESIVEEKLAEQSTPAKHCLDLYEEILTEEVTAKEASFKDLNTEYEKCQKQMKGLINKLKEMQSQNTALQNENLCLKKNISALIKTARVEITRKEEEINRLNQRFASGNVRKRMPNLLSISKTSTPRDIVASINIQKASTQSDIVPPVGISKTICPSEIGPSMNKPKTNCLREAETLVNESKTTNPRVEEPPCDAVTNDSISNIVDHNGKSDQKHQDIHKGSSLTYSPKNAQEKEKHLDSDNSTYCKMRTPYVKLYKENGDSHLQKQTPESYSDIDEKKNRKEKNTEPRHRDSDRRQRKEYRHSSSPSKDKSNAEIKAMSSRTWKHGKRECRENASFKPDDRKYCTSSSWEEWRTTKEKMQLRDEPRLKDKCLKTYDRSPSKKVTKINAKSENLEHGNRATERDENEPRRSKRASSSQLNDENSHKSSRCETIDSRRNSDSGRRKKCSFESSKNSKADGKEINMSTSKYEDKHSRAHNSEKSERDKRNDGKKHSRETKEENKYARNDRREHKEHIETEKNSAHSSTQGKSVNRTEENSINAENENILQLEKDNPGQSEVKTQKNLKLSFMETLNLTLSPVKDKSVCESDANVKSSTVTNLDYGVAETNVGTEISLDLHTNITDLEQDDPIALRLNNPKPSVVTLDDVAALEKPISEMCLSETIEDECGDRHKKQPPVLETDVTVSKTILPTIDNQEVVRNDFETMSSDELETRSVVDGSDINLDSFIEIDKCSGSESPNSDVQFVSCQEDANLPAQTHVDVDSASSVQQNINETSKGISESSNSDLIEISSKGFEHIHDDESSVKSIDLTIMRCMPKVISPLTSPVRPLAKLHTIECTAKASIVRVLHTEPSFETGTGNSSPSSSKELNKENCQPVTKTERGSGNLSHIVLSSDEVEEGEILSDEEVECKPEVPAQITRSPKQRSSTENTNVAKSPSSRKREISPMVKPNGIISPPKKSPSKRKIKMNTKKLKLSNNNANNTDTDACLEGVLKIVQPSTVQDVLQMLRVIREHIRKKYMKFKIQFSLPQFHRVIEIATECFVTLVKRLDWSTICSSPGNLRKKLCKCLESKLSMMKKNGIVDRIFEQHLIDMKKRLWKFVEDQLDSLFDMLKAMLVKLCNKAKAENESNIKNTSDANTNRSVHVKSSSKSKVKSDPFQSSMSEEVTSFKPCLRLAHLEISSETKRPTDSKPKTVNHSVKKLSFFMESEKESRVVECDSNQDLCVGKKRIQKESVSRNLSATSQKLKCPQNTSGLSFDLVSDDHMGDIFKSLLHDKNNLDENKSVEENLWVYRTPEKLNSSSQKCDTLSSSIEDSTPVKISLQSGTSLWLLSPEHSGSFSRLEMLPNPDVLDESCMLEIPTSTSSIKSITDSDERTRSYSSILMEDLAVSLTVPSPLKSDSHLSFLRPVNEPVSEEIVVTRYSEDSLLEGEDVTEQDIHLTLDSDNSSTCSSANPIEPTSFQYHPSEPMQAVIMEKSNDHFIVKIRRAVSAASDCSSGEQIPHMPDLIHLEDENVGHNVQIASSKDEASQEGNVSKLNANENVSQMEPQAEVSDLSKTGKLDSSFVHVENNAEHFKKQFTNTTPETSDLLPTLSDPTSNNAPIRLETTPAIDSCHTVNTPTECAKSMPMSTEIVEKDQLIFNKHCPLSTTSENCGDSLSKNFKKRCKTFENESLAKRKKAEVLSLNKSKQSSRRQGKNAERSTHLVIDKSNKKHRRTVSEGAVPCSSSSSSPNSMSARNLIKKKGEVVAAWSREEDRAILLDCQKLGPTEKTFCSLSEKMNKYPHQIEERFRQLMKLFKNAETQVVKQAAENCTFCMGQKDMDDLHLCSQQRINHFHIAACTLKLSFLLRRG